MRLFSYTGFSFDTWSSLLTAYSGQQSYYGGYVQTSCWSEYYAVVQWFKFWFFPAGGTGNPEEPQALVMVST